MRKKGNLYEMLLLVREAQENVRNVSEGFE
jgi:hypothetical protein